MIYLIDIERMVDGAQRATCKAFRECGVFQTSACSATGIASFTRRPTDVLQLLIEMGA